jgi:hypothetical protein
MLFHMYVYMCIDPKQGFEMNVLEMYVINLGINPNINYYACHNFNSFLGLILEEIRKCFS